MTESDHVGVAELTEPSDQSLGGERLGIDRSIEDPGFMTPTGPDDVCGMSWLARWGNIWFYLSGGRRNHGGNRVNWFRQKRQVHVNQTTDGRWSASVGSISGTVTWVTKDTKVEVVEALRLRLLERELDRSRVIEVDW